MRKIQINLFPLYTPSIQLYYAITDTSCDCINLPSTTAYLSVCNTACKLLQAARDSATSRDGFRVEQLKHLSWVLNEPDRSSSCVASDCLEAAKRQIWGLLSWLPGTVNWTREWSHVVRESCSGYVVFINRSFTAALGGWTMVMVYWANIWWGWGSR